MNETKEMRYFHEEVSYSNTNTHIVYYFDITYNNEYVIQKYFNHLIKTEDFYKHIFVPLKNEFIRVIRISYIKEIPDKNTVISIEELFRNYDMEVLDLGHIDTENIAYRGHFKDRTIMIRQNQYNSLIFGSGVLKINNELKEKDNELKEKDNELKEKDNELKEKDNELKEKDNENIILKKEIAWYSSQKITYSYKEIKEKNKKLNTEFKRIYNLIRKNIGYNLSD